MKESIKKRTNKAYKDTKRVSANAEQFVQAVALLIVVGFGFWALGQLQDDLTDIPYRVVQAALVVMGVRGAYEFIKFLDAERK